MKNSKEIFQKIEDTKVWRENSLQTILKKYPKEGKGLYRHDELVKEKGRYFSMWQAQQRVKDWNINE